MTGCGAIGVVEELVDAGDRTAAVAAAVVGEAMYARSDCALVVNPPPTPTLFI